jgi:hypothetical protein
MPNHNPNFKEYAWKPGVSGNPGGRPAGSRNIRTQEVLDLIRAQGHKDPLVTLSELQNSSDDDGIRATAANMLAPYLHSKLAAKPQPPDPVYVEQAINLPRPTTIKQAYENIALLTEYKSTAKLDFVTADSLINDQKVILYALIDEAKLLAAQGGSPEQVIRIEGGMPVLPGTNIIMPELNGHEIELEAVSALAAPGVASKPTLTPCLTPMTRPAMLTIKATCPTNSAKVRRRCSALIPYSTRHSSPTRLPFPLLQWRIDP